MQAFTAQVQEPVPEPHFLGIFGLARHLHGQHVGRRLHFQRLDGEFHLAGGQAAVDGVVGALHHRSGHRDDAFRARLLGDPEERAGDVDDALGQAVVIAQIDEQEVAVVALGVDPPRQPGRSSGVFEPELSAGVGTIGMHEGKPSPRIAGSFRR